MVDGQNYYAHRLAWLYMTGRWPKEEIDHIDNDRTNDRFDNLREASRLLNSHNQRHPRKKNKVGILGVTFSKKYKTYRASICLNYKKIHLGSFATASEASAAYQAAKKIFHKGAT